MFINLGYFLFFFSSLAPAWVGGEEHLKKGRNRRIRLRATNYGAT